MQICRTIAGYTFGRADVVRRAMAKKKSDVMEQERQAFIYGQTTEDGRVINTGAVAAGMDEAAAGALFDDMAGFAKYAFNKAHASAYAITTYRTAYLKRHYPGEYLASMLSSVTGNVAKTAEYIAEAARMHIPILAPDINESGRQFLYSADGAHRGIRFGLLGIRNVGSVLIDQLLQERRERPFDSFEDFVARMTHFDLTKRQLEALIASGAFDAMPQTPKRSQMLACYERIMDIYTERARTSVTGQLDLFSAATEDSAAASRTRPMDGYRFPDIPEISAREKLLLERGATGLCFSGHLLDDYETHLEQLHPTEIGSVMAAFASEGEEGTMTPRGDFADKQVISIAGIVTKRVAKLTRKGDNMAFITLEDRYGEMEVIVFPKVLDACTPYLNYDCAIFVTGELSVREEEAPKLIARTIFPLRTNDMQMQQDRCETGTAPAPPPAPTAARRTSGRPIPPQAKTLYLRVPRVTPSELLYAHAENYANIFACPTGTAAEPTPGVRVSVVFYDSESAQYRRDLTQNIFLTPYILGIFEELLGEENVILK